MRIDGARLFSQTDWGGVDMIFFAALLFTVHQSPLTDHLFLYRSPTTVASVSVAGTFNNWDKSATPMIPSASDRLSWSVHVKLGPGKTQYKFVVDGKDWILDPKALRNEDDGNGNVNSVLIVLPEGYDRPPNPKSGHITASALFHEVAVPWVNLDRNLLTITLRARPDDFESVELIMAGATAQSMNPGVADEVYRKFSATLPWDGSTSLTYAFRIHSGPRSFTFGPNGLTDRASGNSFRLQASSYRPFVVPSWVEKTVIYQIFPDRFENGDKSNDPPNVMPWNGVPTYDNRFGGDIAGIEKRLNYLSDLGIGTVYFNPIVASPSNHRYDAADFEQVDPEFGTNAQFGRLTAEMHARNIRTVMDFVFHSSSPKFKRFQDVVKHGEASPYKDWYFIKSYPVKVENPPNYVGWFGYAALPMLNLKNRDCLAYMTSLPSFWRNVAHFDGMRLDSANSIDSWFWQALRRREKAADPNVWIVGEVWGDGSQWLAGDQWDSVMNYPFREACLGFFANGKTKASEFMTALRRNSDMYVPQVSRNLMNLLSSHDTPRFLTLCHDDVALDELAATVQFTWPGTPSIYYGEEIGMDGGRDPDDRRPMQWERAVVSNPLLAYYKKLIQIRNSHPALQSGDTNVTMSDDGANTIGYERNFGDDHVVVVLNRSESQTDVVLPLSRFRLHTVPPPKISFVDALTGTKFISGSDGKVHVNLGGKRAAVLIPSSPASAALVHSASLRVRSSATPRTLNPYSRSFSP